MDFPIKSMLERYCFYRRKYVMMTPGFTKHIDAPYTDRQVWEHLNGNISLCVFSGPSNTAFLTFDIDVRDPAVVHRVVDTMEELGIPRDRIYVSDSGGKGYHVDIFFSTSIYNWKAKELYDLVIYFGGLNPRKVEYRPTAKQAIKLPLGIHQRTNRRCWFVDRETLEPIEDMSYIDRTEKVEVWLVDKILKDGNSRRFYRMLGEINEEGQQANDPGARTPSARRTSENRIVEPGTRQRKMIEEALRLYRAGGNYGSIRSDLAEWLAMQDPRMYKDDWDECMRNVANISAWVMRCGRRKELGDDPAHEFRNQARIYRSDAARILQAPTKTARMLAFLFTAYCDRYGYCGLGMQKLCEALGVRTKHTVIAASNALVERGLFYKTRGGLRNMSNRLQKVTNKYRFPPDYAREGDYIDIDLGGNVGEAYARVMEELSDV